MTEVCTFVSFLSLRLSISFAGFWRDDKLRQIAIPLIQQVPQCTTFPVDTEAKSLLQQCLDALVEDVSDDALLKTINLDLLMHTRSESAKVRQFALLCSESLWGAHGGKLLGPSHSIYQGAAANFSCFYLPGFVAETATFIAECGEDENDMVVKESFRLKETVESIAGRIDGL